MEIVIRATVLYFFLWMLTRGLGKRELAEMTAFELLLLVVVKDGRPVEPALRLERVVLDEVLESARNQGISDLRDIGLAILEPSGQFSFLERKAGGDDTRHHPEKHRV